MNTTYLGQEIHELILGEKLNNFKSPHSYIEKLKVIKLAKEWIEQHPNEHIHLYHV